MPKTTAGLKEEMQLQMALWASAEACAAEAAAASASLEPKPHLFGLEKLTQKTGEKYIYSGKLT